MVPLFIAAATTFARLHGGLQNAVNIDFHRF